MSIATKDDIEGWLKDFGIDTYSKTEAGNWNLVQQLGDSKILVSIMYFEPDPKSPPMIGVGCLFLDPPEKNQCELYRKLLEIHNISQETKFCIVTNGAIMLITHRSALDLDQSELKAMIETVVKMYARFHDECLSVIS